MHLAGILNENIHALLVRWGWGRNSVLPCSGDGSCSLLRPISSECSTKNDQSEFECETQRLVALLFHCYDDSCGLIVCMMRVY